jgi:hypothetical protein
VGREREKKNNKTDILRVRSIRKKKLLIKKIWICERRLFHLFQKIIFFFGVYVRDDWIPDNNLPIPDDTSFGRLTSQFILSGWSDCNTISFVCGTSTAVESVSVAGLWCQVHSNRSWGTLRQENSLYDTRWHGRWLLNSTS